MRNVLLPLFDIFLTVGIDEVHERGGIPWSEREGQDERQLGYRHTNILRSQDCLGRYSRVMSMRVIASLTSWCEIRYSLRLTDSYLIVDSVSACVDLYASNSSAFSAYGLPKPMLFDHLRCLLPTPSSASSIQGGIEAKHHRGWPQHDELWLLSKKIRRFHDQRVFCQCRAKI